MAAQNATDHRLGIDAAVRLTTSTFDINPILSSAETLRHTMVSYLDGSSDPKNAYPAYRAFVIVGRCAVTVAVAAVR
jgi:hypothetical protein